MSQQAEERASALAKENENLMKVVNSRRSSLPVSLRYFVYLCILTELHVVTYWRILPNLFY